MWHRAGALLVTTSAPGTRVGAQDWSELTLEAWPTAEARVVRRTVYERGGGGGGRTELAMATTAAEADENRTTTLRLDVSASGTARAWVLRAHLAPGQRVVAAAVDGAAVDGARVAHIAPLAAGGADDAGFFPLRGAGHAPPARAGPVAELRVPRAAGAREVELQIGADEP